MRRMFARMLVHENAGVAGYSEAFMYGQSGKQASIRSGYLRIDVLGVAGYAEAFGNVLSG